MAHRQRVRAIAVADPHAPFTDPQALRWAARLVRTRRPHYLFCLGDLFEAHHASVHPDEHDHDALDEYRAGARILDTLRRAAPARCRCVWLLGNHDDNIQRNDSRRVPRHLRRAVHWNNSRFAESFLRWRQVPYIKSAEGCFQLGQVIFTHGFSLRPELEAVQFANYTGGYGNRLVVSGHTHAPLAPTQARRTLRIPLPLWHANPGTLADMNALSYADRSDRSVWGTGLVYVECDPHGLGGAGCRWHAETLIYRMYGSPPRARGGWR